MSSKTSAFDGFSKVVAVTGGAGFIGSHLCTRLAAENCDVYCLDNFHTGRRINIPSGLSITVVDHDILKPLRRDLPRFDEIYHLACPASPVHYQEDRVRTALVCAMGTHNVLEQAAADGARLVQASTSEVYGDPEIHPQTEDYCGNVNPIGPRSCYDEGKRFAETLVTDFGRQTGLRVKIARIFNTYGPRMQPQDGRVVSNFIVQALRREPITLYGKGSQTRSFCYVSDLVDGLIRLMSSGDEVTGPVNLGNPTETTVNALATLIAELVGGDLEFVHRPLPIDDPRRRKPDITRARQWLGWEPKTSLREGVVRTIDYFRTMDLSGGALPQIALQRESA